MLYVRSTTMRYSDGSEDHYTSFWSGREHQWCNLSAATVFTEAEVKSYRVIEREGRKSGFVSLERNGQDYYVPVEGEFTPLPETLRLASMEEMFG